MITQKAIDLLLPELKDPKVKNNTIIYSEHDVETKLCVYHKEVIFSEEVLANLCKLYIYKHLDSVVISYIVNDDICIAEELGIHENTKYGKTESRAIFKLFDEILNKNDK